MRTFADPSRIVLRETATTLHEVANAGMSPTLFASRMEAAAEHGLVVQLNDWTWATTVLGRWSALADYQSTN